MHDRHIDMSAPLENRMPPWKNIARGAVALAVGDMVLASTLAQDTSGRTPRGTGRITYPREVAYSEKTRGSELGACPVRNDWAYRSE